MQRYYKTLFAVSVFVGNKAYGSIIKTQGRNDKGSMCVSAKLLRQFSGEREMAKETGTEKERRRQKQ